MTITRIKFENRNIKAFDGRKKITEVDLSDQNQNVFMGVVELLVEEFKKDSWVKDENQWRDETGTIPINMDEEEFKSYIQELINKILEDSIVDVSDDATTTDADDRRRMRITPEQRQRKTPVQDWELALDDFVIEHGIDGSLKVKGRRMLNLRNFQKVINENGITVNGVDNGHRKMNMRNILNGKINRGESILINGVKYE